MDGRNTTFQQDWQVGFQCRKTIYLILSPTRLQWEHHTRHIDRTELSLKLSIQEKKKILNE